MGIYIAGGDLDRTMFYECLRQDAVDRAAPWRLEDNAELERIVRRAAEAYDTCASAVSIVHRHRQILVARVGIEFGSTPRGDAFCDVTIQRPGEPLIVPDARRDARFQRMNSVMMSPHVRFYAGHAIVDGAGYPLGALCVFDPLPREGDVDTTTLTELARSVERVLNR